MGKILVGHENAILDAVLSTITTAAPSLPVVNLKDEQGAASNGFQTASGVITAAAGAGFIGVLPASRALRAFSLHRTNLTTNAQIRWRVGTEAKLKSSTWNSAKGSEGHVYDSGWIPAGVAARRSQSVLILAAAVSGPAFRCDIDDATNPDGFINIPLAFVGPLWAPTYNFSYDSSTGWEEGKSIQETQAGGKYIRQKWERRIWSLSLQALLHAEVWSDFELILYKGRRGQNILFIPDPDSTYLQSQALFGDIAESSNLTYPVRSRLFRGWTGKVSERL